MHRIKIILVLIFVVTISVFIQSYFFPFTLDDTFIPLRYLLNWIDGHGLVWNRGEYVEGYSSFLFVIILAPFAFLKFNLLYTAKILSSLFGIGTIVVTYLVSRKYFKGKSSRLYLISPLLLAITWYFNLWSIGGMETTLLAFLITFYCHTALDPRKRNLLIGFILTLIALTRPEGPIFFFPYLIYAIGTKSKLKNLSGLLVFPLTFGLYLIWRFSYYGDFLPNTYYAKIYGGGSPTGGLLSQKLINGLIYSFDFLASQGVLFTYVFIIGLVYLIIKKAEFKSLRFLLLNIIFYLIFIVYSGGDWMVGYRFFIPILPLIYLALQEIIIKVIANSPSLKIKKPLEITVLIFLIASVLFGELKNSYQLFQLEMYRNSPATVAAYLKTQAQDNDLVAVNEAGELPYLTMNLNYIDILGLNNKHIAKEVNDAIHAQHGDPEYILSREPDWMVFWVSVDPTGKLKWSMPAVSAIINHPRTKANYELVQKIPQPQNGEAWSNGHVYWIYKKR